ncbi:MAG: SDR family oxidoreductase [Cytophagales bacterium]|nr:SDR family oxidoreductase [Cytophagales bacterium]
MQINLKNKNVIVTGASRGIGKSIAELLVSCGANVALQYIRNKNRAEKVKKQLGPKAVLYQCDFSDGLEVGSFFNKVEKDFKRIDVLINNAGIAINSDPDKDDIAWVDDWLQTMDVNLNSVALLCKKAIAHFRKSSGGIIINISSRAAFRGDTRDYMAYAASKAGVVGLTRSIARAYGKEGIKAFLVAPGFVRTGMAQDFIDEYGEDYALENIALDRMTEPEDVAQFVAFLASGLANHATGGTFDINAGSYMH